MSIIKTRARWFSMEASSGTVRAFNGNDDSPVGLQGPAPQAVSRTSGKPRHDDAAVSEGWIKTADGSHIERRAQVVT